MAILSMFVFGAAFGLACWTMVATVRPQFARIVDLIVSDPAETNFTPIPVRATLRDVRVRRLAPAPLRAAA